jgi:hypothetical protein
MALRWAGAAMHEAAKGFRRLKAHKQLPILQKALAARMANAVSSNENLEGSVRSRGTDDGSGTVRDLIEAGLNEPVDAASLWDLCCGACSG